MKIVDNVELKMGEREMKKVVQQAGVMIK